jgi:hypothetical protein
MHRTFGVTLALLLFCAVFQGVAAAQPLATKLEVRCDDETLTYQITGYALAVVKGSMTHVPTNDGAAARHIRLAIARVLNGDEVTAGIALAILVTKSTSQGQTEVMHFSNQIIPLSELEATIRREVQGVLR